MVAVSIYFYVRLPASITFMPAYTEIARRIFCASGAVLMVFSAGNFAQIY